MPPRQLRLHTLRLSALPFFRSLLDRGINDAATVARVSADMLSRELEATPLPEQSTNAKRRLAAAWQFAKALPIVASAIKVIEWVKGLIPFI